MLGEYQCRFDNNNQQQADLEKEQEISVTTHHLFLDFKSVDSTCKIMNNNDLAFQ